MARSQMVARVEHEFAIVRVRRMLNSLSLVLVVLGVLILAHQAIVTASSELVDWVRTSHTFVVPVFDHWIVIGFWNLILGLLVIMTGIVLYRRTR